MKLAAALLVILPAFAADCTGLSSANCHTFVLLPDEQNLVQGGIGANQALLYQSLFSTTINDRTAWNIQAVLGLGDVVNTSYCDAYNLANPGSPGGCTDNYLNSESLHASYSSGATYSGYIQLDHVSPAIPYLIIPGNHDLSPTTTQSAPYSVLRRNYAEDWKDTPDVSGHNVPATGKFSAKYLTSLGHSWYSDTAQFYPAGVNRNSWFTLDIGGVKWLLIGSGFGEPADAMTWLASAVAAHSDSNALFVTHSMAFGNLANQSGTHHTAALMGYSCQSFCNSIYGMDATNSTSGIDTSNLLGKPYPNMIAMFSGHEFTQAAYNDHWSTNTAAATDGHNIVYGHFDFQDLDQNQGTAAGAEAAYLVYITVRNQSTLEVRIKSAWTGHAVDADHVLPQAGNAFDPVATYPVTLVSQAVPGVPEPPTKVIGTVRLLGNATFAAH